MQFQTFYNHYTKVCRIKNSGIKQIVKYKNLSKFTLFVSVSSKLVWKLYTNSLHNTLIKKPRFQSLSIQVF
jgi:hypothetical protein